MNSTVTVFEASGSIAMFRKPYTTTSSVSFAFPPPTAIAGMIAAITGIENGSGKDASNAHYWQYMNGTRVAVRIMDELKWQKHSLNFTNTKDPQKNPRIQVKHQFVGSPRYRIYVAERWRNDYETCWNQLFHIHPVSWNKYAIADLHYIGSFPWQ